MKSEIVECEECESEKNMKDVIKTWLKEFFLNESTNL